MVEYYGDLIDSASITTTPLGKTITKKVYVRGCVGATLEQKEYYAIDNLGIYIGQQNPYYADSYLQNITTTFIDTDTAEVVITYEPMTNVPVEISVSSRTTSTQTNKDKDDTPIEVSYTYPATYDKDPNKANKEDTVGQTVDIQVPSVVINYKTREIVSGGSLVDRGRAYLAKLNASGWNLRPTDEEGTWLVDVLDSTLAGYVWQNNTLLTVYDVTYNFSAQYGGWNTEVVYINPDTGAPPEPSTWTEDTKKEIELYATANLSSLNLV